MEGAELDGDAGADAEERGEGALVEGKCALVLVDGGRRGEGVGVGCCCLEANLDDVEGLAWGVGALVGRKGVLGKGGRTGRERSVPRRTCATPPTAPAKRSLAVCRPALPCSSISAAASAIVAAPLYEDGGYRREGGISFFPDESNFWDFYRSRGSSWRG